MVGVGVGWREDRRSGLPLPHAIVAAADAQMIAIPALERFRIAGAEEGSAYTGYPPSILS